MPRAFDLFALELALIERAAVMRAQVIDRIKLAVDVADSDVVVADAKHRDALGRNVRHGPNCLPGRHERNGASASKDHTRSSTDGSCRRASVDWKNPSTMSCSAVARSNPRDCK